MYRVTDLIVVLFLCILPAMQAHANSDNSTAGKNEMNAVTITVDKQNISDKPLELRYTIRNGSELDIWICEIVDRKWSPFEAFMAEDNKTLLIRRQLDLPMKIARNQPIGRYVRLPKGESRMEYLLFPLPFRAQRVFLGGRLDEEIKQTKRLEIKIGFYAGDLPGMIFSILDEIERRDKRPYVSPVYPKTIRDWLEGSLEFTVGGEDMQNREDQVEIPWTNQNLKGEQVLRTTVDDLLIPYIDGILTRKSEEAEVKKFPRLLAEDVSHCTRIEICYQPSMFEYFFPYAKQQSLLSAAEKQHLQSLRTIVVDDKELIKAFAEEIGEGLHMGAIVTEFRKVHAVCYRNDERLTSFTVYGDRTIFGALRLPLLQTDDSHTFTKTYIQ